MTSSWVIFDADNTLWDVEQFYDEARIQLCEYLETKGCSRDAVEIYQRSRDVELQKTYGYSACRFARSFEDSVIEFLGGSGFEAEIIHCRALALNIFEKKPTLHVELDKVFNHLKSNYNLGLITAGERWVQEKRLNEFSLYSVIDSIEIVEKKTAGVFLEFIRKHDLDPSRSWMVGDSWKSDVEPALAAGLNVIWFDSHNWKEYENSGSAADCKVEKINDLRELLTKL